MQMTNSSTELAPLATVEVARRFVGSRLGRAPSTRTVREWIRRGVVASRLVGGRRYIPRTELERLVGETTETAAS